ncbi:MAG: hypothetical protein KJ000_33080 [Pirellulaceae bacterium]|nr:hypothetical protein [Pirellulaceae bacterium]
MNDSIPNQEQRPRHRRRWLLVLLLLPVALGAIVVAVLAIGEYRSSRAVAADVVRLRDAGEPVDNESMARWFMANTSQEGTAAWREILVAVEQVSSSQTVSSFPIMGTGKFPDDLVPGGDWPDEPQIAEFLREVQPLIAQIEQAAQYPTPVWQPIAFDSFSTLLPEIQTSRSVIRLLSLEVRHALYHRDTERAMRGLAAMQAATEAFDWDFCMVVELVGIALRNIHRDAIRQSLKDTAWEPEQLDQLLAQVAQPRDVATHWRHNVTGERAMALALFQGTRERQRAMLDDGQTGFPSLLMLIPSGIKRYLERLAAMQRLGDAGVLGLAARAEASENDLGLADKRRLDDILTALLLPAVHGIARAYERDELDRRLARTALGIKRYQLAEGRWPEKLSDLTAVGLEARDWTALQAGPFGYLIEADGAVVWAYDANDPDSPSRIRSEPPTAEDVASNLDWHVTRIR